MIIAKDLKVKAQDLLMEQIAKNTRLMMAAWVAAETPPGVSREPVGTGDYRGQAPPTPPLSDICSLKIEFGGMHMITRTSNRIKIEGHVGTWHVIDEGYFELTPDVDQRPETIRAHLFLLEHEEHGDEAACVIVAEDGKLVIDDVWNGFDDLDDAGWERVWPRACPVCGKEFLRDDMIFTRDCHGITFRLVCLECYEKVMAKGYDGQYYTEADECIEGDY